MKRVLVVCDKRGWPVAYRKGHPVQRLLRYLIHGRKLSWWYRDQWGGLRRTEIPRLDPDCTAPPRSDCTIAPSWYSSNSELFIVPLDDGRPWLTDGKAFGMYLDAAPAMKEALEALANYEEDTRRHIKDPNGVMRKLVLERARAALAVLDEEGE